MKKIRTIFFDVKEYEKEFLIKNMPNEIDYTFVTDNFHLVCEREIDRYKDAEIISIFTDSRVNANYMKKFQNLKMVSARSTGFSHIDLDYCKKYDIAVVNVPRYGDATVAEFAFGLLLNVARKINIAYSDLQEGTINTHKYIGIDLIDKNIGIIGTGAIGSNAIRIAHGFGMKILAYDPFPKKELISKYKVKYVNLNELYSESDIISIHAPSTKENFHMINNDAFSKMKDGVVFINTARGEIVDTEALYKALVSEKVAAAGLDVVECEDILANQEQYLAKIDCVKQDCLAKTLINHRLLSMPNVVVTPHVAFDTKEAIGRILKTTIDNLQGYINNKIINNVCC
ncbi:MAG: NAD(P)-dependent oxidoreductase [Candidatus Gastranaerophilales bacterium]|nr:NAD(P)-dependent oxidoreductase [Candidatus Gastranaerophilales bacterium]